MIIVSQDKRTIINFDNLTQIYITKDEEETPYKIHYETSSKREELGKYATEERAKEVIQQIVKGYRAYRTAEFYGYTNVLEETAVFEMPEE